ncbi:hypothetical protein AVEN_48992-1 [Araneus ventricosus]|uniref:Uncharacterized protein n=1 Tax=Araneus ventricosus TaxID=182803 RepID=A0A4Y2AJC3_ARAVE|nr:hypothetical protein AVEN_48992-1 [Araneus ventricosus]
MHTTGRRACNPSRWSKILCLLVANPSPSGRKKLSPQLCDISVSVPSVPPIRSSSGHRLLLWQMRYPAFVFFVLYQSLKSDYTLLITLWKVPSAVATVVCV